MTHTDKLRRALRAYDLAGPETLKRANALARIACLEGEIAKRDETIARLEPQLNRAIQANYDLREELAACRIAVENCEVFRARIAELEARIVWLECEAQVNAAPVSEAKAQGVVIPAELDRAFITGESCDGVYRVAIQSETLKEMQAVHSWLTSLNAAPAAPAADAWIPVSERLPDIAQEVIVHSEFDGVCAGVLDSYGEWFAPCSEYKLIRVTSWMPMPTKIEANHHD